MPRILWWSQAVLVVLVLVQAHGQVNDESIPKHCCGGSIKMQCSRKEQKTTLLGDGQVVQPQQVSIPVEYYTNALLPGETQRQSVPVSTFNAQLRASGYLELFKISGAGVEIDGCRSTNTTRPYRVQAAGNFSNAPAKFQSGCVYEVRDCPPTSLGLLEPMVTPTKLEPVLKNTRLTQSDSAHFHYRIVDSLSSAELQIVRYQLADNVGMVFNGSGAADTVLSRSGVGIIINSTDVIVTMPRTSAPQTVRLLIKFRKVELRSPGPPWQGQPSEYYLLLNAPGMPGAGSAVPPSVRTPATTSLTYSSAQPPSGGPPSGRELAIAIGTAVAVAVVVAVVVITLLCFLGKKRRKARRDRNRDLREGVHNVQPRQSANGQSGLAAAYSGRVSLEEPSAPARQDTPQPPAPAPLPPPTPSPSQPSPPPKDVQSNDPGGPPANQEAESSDDVPESVEEREKYPGASNQGWAQEESTPGGGELVPGATAKVDRFGAPTAMYHSSSV